MKTFNSTFLIQRRKFLKLSQQEVADDIDVHQTTYHHWESGKSTPQANHLMLLSELFKCDISDFYQEKISLLAQLI